MLGPRFSSALAYAAELHRDQKRKGTNIPYISHLLAVSSLAIEHCADEDEAIAALLHDAVEDQGGAPTLAFIRKTYGDRVASIVDANTDTDVVPKPPWKERKQAYIDSIPDKDASSRFVSLADKVHNARAIVSDYREVGERLWERFNGGRAGTIWYYDELRKAFRGRTPDRLWSELNCALNELDALMNAAKLH